jgi:aminoglycoside phosphotransferase (APT) family kinase protein
MADELRILHERLPLVTREQPRWAGRIERLLKACDRLGAATPEPVMCGIHRDFYADQVIVDGARLHLIDFDLYCEGDPALDVGNFLGHLTEQSLRAFGDPEALASVEEAMEERFVELSGEAARCRVGVYKTLTLVRHVHLSTLFPERRPFTGRLLGLCEERIQA